MTEIGREGKHEKQEQERDLLPIGSLPKCNSQDRASLKPAVENFVQIPPGGRNPSEPSYATFPCVLAKRWNETKQALAAAL